jgi:hypothetical protein
MPQTINSITVDLNTGYALRQLWGTADDYGLHVEVQTHGKFIFKSYTVTITDPSGIRQSKMRFLASVLGDIKKIKTT